MQPYSGAPITDTTIPTVDAPIGTPLTVVPKPLPETGSDIAILVYLGIYLLIGAALLMLLRRKLINKKLAG